MKSINEVQEEIIEDFSFFPDEDRNMKNEYLMELGEAMPPLSSEFKVPENVIKGCQSTVWLNAYYQDGKIFFEADSNTGITKGVISLLIRVLSGRTPQEILHTNLYFVEKIGLNSFLSSLRSGGTAAMLMKMKTYAVAFQAKSLQN